MTCKFFSFFIIIIFHGRWRNEDMEGEQGELGFIIGLGEPEIFWLRLGFSSFFNFSSHAEVSKGLARDCPSGQSAMGLNRPDF